MGEQHTAAELAPGGVPRHGAWMDEPPKGLPGTAAVKNLNGGKPFKKEAGSSNLEGCTVGGDGAAGGRRANGLPDGDAFHVLSPAAVEAA
eukprot:7917974-Heterocapsa_arctica.AAC.2